MIGISEGRLEFATSLPQLPSRWHTVSCDRRPVEVVAHGIYPEPGIRFGEHCKSRSNNPSQKRLICSVAPPE